jgi:uncharacterized membrane protein
MNIALWIVQVLLALVFVGVGVNHVFRYDALKVQPRMSWVGALPRSLLAFIGICEILGAIGLILPPITNILPWLTPLAASLLAVMMLLASIFHFRRRENFVGNLILLALAAFVAYGRFVLVPF